MKPMISCSPAVENQDRNTEIRKKASTRFFYYWCVLFALYFPLVVLICDYVARPRSIDILEYYVFEELIIAWIVNLLILLPGIILPILILPCMLCAYWLMMLPTLTFAGCYLLFKQRFSYELSKFLWNTNWNQAYEFLRSMLSPSIWAIAIIIALVPLIMIYCAMRSHKPKNTWKRVAALLPLVAVLVVYEGYILQLHRQHPRRAWVERNFIVHLFKTYPREFYKFQGMYGWERSSLEFFVNAPRDHFPLTGLQSAKGPVPVTGVILVGESSSRLNYGLYGYFRDTTPRLSAMSQDLFVFDRAEVASGASMRSLLGVFSFVDQENPSVFDYKCSIFDILNNAHFKTFWFTNSVIETLVAFAAGDSFVRLLNTNVQHYVDVDVRNEEGKHLDIAVLPLLEETMDTVSGDKGIFIRFMGSHMHYPNRYPASFDYFHDHPDDPKRPWLTDTKKQAINFYDNTIRYTDFVVAEIIEAVRRRGGNSFVLYFSDHGDEVFQTQDLVGRMDSNAKETPAVLKVPLILWMSEDYKKNFPEIAEAARRNEHKDFVLDDLFWTMNELYGVTFDGFRPEKSLVNPNYLP